MTRTQKAVILIQLAVLVALVGMATFHAVQFAYILTFYGIDAPFEDWTQFSWFYYRVDRVIKDYTDVNWQVWEDGSFIIQGCLPGTPCDDYYNL